MIISGSFLCHSLTSITQHHRCVKALEYSVYTVYFTVFKLKILILSGDCKLIVLTLQTLTSKYNFSFLVPMHSL